jgi:hypothetical protein
MPFEHLLVLQDQRRDCLRQVEADCRNSLGNGDVFPLERVQNVQLHRHRVRIEDSPIPWVAIARAPPLEDVDLLRWAVVLLSSAPPSSALSGNRLDPRP